MYIIKKVMWKCGSGKAFESGVILPGYIGGDLKSFLGGGPIPTPSFICSDVVEDFVFFISIARCSHRLLHIQ